MYKVLDKDMIENQIVAYIPKTERGIRPEDALARDCERHPLQAEDRRPLGATARNSPFRKSALELVICVLSLPQVVQELLLEGMLDKVP